MRVLGLSGSLRRGSLNTALLRMPYSSLPSSVTIDQYRAAKDAARYGYLIVLATQDPIVYECTSPLP